MSVASYELEHTDDTKGAEGRTLLGGFLQPQEVAQALSPLLGLMPIKEGLYRYAVWGGAVARDWVLVRRNACKGFGPRRYHRCKNRHCHVGPFSLSHNTAES